MKSSLYIGSLSSPQDIHSASQAIVRGEIIAAQVYGVFGFFADGLNKDTLYNILKAKQDPNIHKPFSSMSFSSSVDAFIDKNKVHASLRHITDSPEIIEQVAGSVMHLRLPLHNDHYGKIPASLRSEINNTWVIHNIDPSFHPIADLIRAINAAGVPFVAVTTINKHGKPEVTNLREAISYCKSLLGCSYAPKILLKDPIASSKTIRGSFAIVDAISASVVREGFIPTPLLETILGTSLDSSSMTPAKHPHDPDFYLLNTHLRQSRQAPAARADRLRQHLKGERRGRLAVFAVGRPSKTRG